MLSERCFRHAGREAASRCPSCQRYYCRECVSEHEGRVLCAECLERVSAGPVVSQRHFPAIAGPLSVAAGIFVAWVFFAAIGNFLLLFPDTFHDTVNSGFSEAK